MLPAYSAFLGFRYLLSRWINVVGAIGVSVAVWALIVVIAVFSGFIGETRDHIYNASPELLVTSLPAEADFAELEPLCEDPDVVAYAPRLRHYGMLFPYGRMRQRLQMTEGMQTSPLAFDFVELVGIDQQAELATTGFHKWLQGPSLVGDGVSDFSRPLDVSLDVEQQWRRRMRMSDDSGPLLRSSPGLLLSHPRMQVGQMTSGQQVAVVTGRFAREDGESVLRKVRKQFAVAGAFKTEHRGVDDTAAFVPIDELREMLGHPAGDPFGVELISDIAIRVRPGADLKAVGARLRERFADTGAEVLDWEQQNHTLLGAVDQERGIMKLILFAVMLVSAFLIYATLHMMVTQKIKDIGILSAIGASPGGVLRTFLWTGSVVSVTGCLIGAVAGILSTLYLNDIDRFAQKWFGVGLFPPDMYALDAIPYRLEAGWIIQVLIGALLISFLAAWLPARRASRMDPVRALAYE